MAEISRALSDSMSNARAWLRPALALGLAALALSGADAQRPAQTAGATYTNPIINRDFPDPSALRVGDTMYIYGTGDTGGEGSGRYVPMTMSHDLKTWSAPRTVLELPVWASGAIWAPHVIQDPKRPNRFVMFFSAKAKPGAKGVPAGSKLCLAVAVSDKPDGIFKPLDHPLDKDACRNGDGDIDPYVFYDPKPGADPGPFLYWGSAHKPIRRQKIANDLLSLVPGTKINILSPTATSKSQSSKYTDLVEGSWVVYRDGHYYIFTSGFQCCDRDDDAYAVVVWRSDDPKGPWTRDPGGKGGAIVHANEKWKSPGHNGIFTDGAGQDWIIYHARYPGRAGRVLMMDRLVWDGGWPHIATDAAPDTPSKGPMPAPAPLQ